MTPEEALALTKTVADLYGQSVTDLLRTIVSVAMKKSPSPRSLAKGMRRPQWAEERLVETPRLRRNASAIAAAMQQRGARAVFEVLEDAYRGGRLIPRSSPGMPAHISGPSPPWPPT